MFAILAQSNPILYHKEGLVKTEVMSTVNPLPLQVQGYVVQNHKSLI